MSQAYDPMRGYTTQQHMRNRERVAAGYKIEEGLSVDEINPGDGVIILNLKGEPSMSGKVDSVGDDGITVGGTLFPSSEFVYRRM